MPRGAMNHKKKGLKKKEWKPPSKAGRVFIKNLPFTVTEDDLEKHFLQFGDVREVSVPKRNDGKLFGWAFVQFTRTEAAERAIEECTGQDFMGREITVDFALPKSEFVGKRVIEGGKKKPGGRGSAIKEESDNETSHWKTNDEVDNKSKKQKAMTKKEKYFEREKKRARIILRNVAFTVTEDKIREHFEEFGEIIDIKILKKSDGSKIGCAFLEYKKRQQGVKAILGRSGKPFLGRPVICDWALPKEKFLGKVQNGFNASNEAKVQEQDSSDVKIKEEPVSSESDDETAEEKKTSFSDDLDQDIDDSKEVKKEEEEDDDDDDDDDEFDSEEEEKKPSLNLPKKRSFEDDAGNERKRPRVISNDATEGCTIFMKNVPFSVTSEQLKKCVEQIGPVHYALVCIDPFTEHSRGTAFAKFKNKDDADKCLEEGLVLQDTAIEALRALPRDEIKKRNEVKKEKVEKDRRHLYLVKEGVILAGSPAAKGVSVADMEKRLKVEQMKTQMLRNLNMFVSNTRLIVYNVPPNWTDDQVRQLFKKHGGPRSELREARIMRDMRNFDGNGFGASKGHAFVRFMKQEDALRALRSINNNPDIFTPNKRPIVSFSIENKNIHKIKQRRIEKSKMNNPTYRSKEPVAPSTSAPTSRNRRNAKQNYQQTPNQNPVEIEGNSYSGITAVPGNKKLRSKFKLKTQNTVHVQNVRKEKRKIKMKKKTLEQRQMKKREPKIKKKRAAEHDSFSVLVDKYKSKLINQDSRKKWYE